MHTLYFLWRCGKALSEDNPKSNKTSNSEAVAGPCITTVVSTLRAAAQRISGLLWDNEK